MDWSIHTLIHWFLYSPSVMKFTNSFQPFVTGEGINYDLKVVWERLYLHCEAQCLVVEPVACAMTVNSENSVNNLVSYWSFRMQFFSWSFSDERRPVFVTPGTQRSAAQRSAACVVREQPCVAKTSISFHSRNQIRSRITSLSFEWNDCDKNEHYVSHVRTIQYPYLYCTSRLFFGIKKMNGSSIIIDIHTLLD